MDNDELLDMFIQERINVLLLSLDKKQPTRTEAEHNKILDAENIIENLSNKDKILVQEYINNIIERMAREEPFLYKQGFLDGMKTFKNIVKL